MILWGNDIDESLSLKGITATSWLILLGVILSEGVPLKTANSLVRSLTTHLYAYTVLLTLLKYLTLINHTLTIPVHCLNYHLNK
jgi:hypothetical protein